MAYRYRATNILTGNAVEGSASELADALCTEYGRINSACLYNTLICGKWKVEYISEMRYQRKCKVCGKEFESRSSRAFYCSTDCSNESSKRGYLKDKTKGYKQRTKSLSDIATEARKAGMTYGQYVVKMGL